MSGQYWRDYIKGAAAGGKKARERKLEKEYFVSWLLRTLSAEGVFFFNFFI